MTSISPTLPHHVTASGLPEHYRAIRERLYGLPARPKLRLVPKDEPEPEQEQELEPSPRERLPVTAFVPERRLTILSIEEERPVVAVGRHLSRAIAENTLAAFCAEAGMPVKHALGASRVKSVVAVRWACWAHLHDQGYSLSAIGHAYGWDHTTVRYGVRKYKSGVMA